MPFELLTCMNESIIKSIFLCCQTKDLSRTLFTKPMPGNLTYVGQVAMQTLAVQLGSLLVQCNLDLVTLNLVTTCDLVTILQRPFFNLLKVS